MPKIARGPVPEPWLRKSTGTYYVTLDGKQIRLGETKREAHEEFRRIMNARGQGSYSTDKITISELKDLWLHDCKRKTSRHTYKNYDHHINSFCDSCGSLLVRDLKSFHVSDWVANHKWKQSTEHLAISVVKVMVSWGEDKGYIDTNPIRRLKRPAIERRAPITAEDAVLIMYAVRPEIATALRILLVTGIRPGELCSMVGDKIDLKARKAIVKGKTGVRTIPLSEAAIEVLEPLVKSHPTGAIIVGTKGEPLTTNALEACVRRARRKLAIDRGMGIDALDHIKPHCFRGLFATEALRNGVAPEMASLLLGHKGTSMMFKHYASPDDQMMLDAADLATRKSGKTSDTHQEPLE